MVVINKGFEAISLLIDLGADKNAPDADGWTPLHWAVCLNRAKVISKLIELGADKNITNKLMDACKLVSITVLDHIIIGRDEYFSFAENGLLG